MPAFAYQLYSSRNFGTLAETFAMLAGLGYAEVEAYGALFETDADVQALETALTANGLAMPSAHIGLEMIEATPDRVNALAQRLGIETVFLPYLAAEDRPSDAAGWRDLGARIDRATAPSRAAGLAVGWHNHDFELMPFEDGTLPLDAMLEGGPSLKLELDLGWVKRAGADPLALIDRYRDRIVAVHIKDVAPEGDNSDEDGWADVGHGVTDWPAIARALSTSNARHLVIEHDSPADDGRFASRSLAAAQAAWSN